MANLTMQTLGDWVRFAPDAFPVGFISGRPGALTPEARAVAQLSMQVAAANAPAPGSRGVDLPVGPVGLFAAPMAAVQRSLAQDPLINAGVPWGPGDGGPCGQGDLFQLRTPFEATQDTLDVTPIQEQFASGQLQPTISFQQGDGITSPVLRMPTLDTPLQGLDEVPWMKVLAIGAAVFVLGRIAGGAREGFRRRKWVKPKPVSSQEYSKIWADSARMWGGR